MRFLLAIILITVCFVMNLMTMGEFYDKGLMLSYLFGKVVVVPSVIAALFTLPKKNFNNKIYFKAFNIITFLFILILIPKMYKIHGQPPKILIGKHGLIELTVPNSWRYGNQTGDYISFSLLDQTGLCSFIVAYEPIEENILDIKQKAKLIGNRFETEETFTSKSDIKNCTVTGFGCAYQEIKMSGDKGTTSLVASLKSENYYYNLIASTNTVLYDDRKEEFIKVMQSIKEK